MNKQIIFLSILSVMLLIPTIAKSRTAHPSSKTSNDREYTIHNNSGKAVSIYRSFHEKEEILAPNDIKKISESGCFDTDEGTICDDKVSWKINGKSYDLPVRIGQGLEEELHIYDDGKYTLSALNNAHYRERITKSSR